MKSAPDSALRPGPAGVLGLCLAGPTACGKTAVALALARSVPLEIISVDSALVYRGMDIGTAKPDAAERSAVPHHLIDICEPHETYSAARFAAQAGPLAAQIRSRGKLPLLVGGTMLYFKALREGLNALPAADRATREQIDREAALQGWPALHAELARVDPVTAARLAPADAQRIQRALEVWRLSGQPISAWHQMATRDAPVAGAWPVLSLEPASRAWLHDRIGRRWEQMMAQGFLEEVLRLRSRPGLHAGLPALRCVGYRQAWQAVEQALLEGQALTELRWQRGWQEAAIAATRQMAKRQLTWLRSVPERQIAHGDSPGLLDACLDWVGKHWRALF